MATPEQAIADLDASLRFLQEVLVEHFGERGWEAFERVVEKLISRLRIYDLPLDEDEAAEILSEAL